MHISFIVLLTLPHLNEISGIPEDIPKGGALEGSLPQILRNQKRCMSLIWARGVANTQTYKTSTCGGHITAKMGVCPIITYRINKYSSIVYRKYLPLRRYIPQSLGYLRFPQ